LLRMREHHGRVFVPNLLHMREHHGRVFMPNFNPI
jgi:hypothetical protein